jgi:protein gp37
MNAESKIVEWTEQPWNPVTGCTKISSGCLNCYAENVVKWLQKIKNPRYKNGFNITLHEDLLDEPLKWKKPKRIFIGSMSDIFHDDIPTDFILRVFDTMNNCPQHTFIVLTKRADRMVELSGEINWTENIWLGVTVEEARYKERIELLRKTGAYRKFVCAEPLIGDLGEVNLSEIDWLVIGGESGKNSRPLEEEWVVSLRDQFQEQGVMFTFKQWGGRFRKRNGSLLQGEYHHDLPEVMRD